MKKYLKFGNNGAPVYFEIDEISKGETLVSGDKTGSVYKATQSLEKHLEAIEPIFKKISSMFEDLPKTPQAPQEFEVELGLKINAEAGVIVSKVGGEAHMTIRACWKK